MKKNIIMAMIAAIVSMSMCATNCLTMGDTIRIKPVKLDGYSKHVVTMFNEGFCDSWTMAVTYPDGFTPKLVSGITPLDGMTVPYTDRYGNEQVYECPLNISAYYLNIGSSITVNGYWDYRGNGELESYGTVKWAPGAHAMFEFNFYVDPEFRAGYITFDGRITSGYDQRGAILQDVRFYTKCWVYVGYMKGDVTGNERLSIDDVTAMIDYLLTGEGFDEFSLAAADVNGDGAVTIIDTTDLINMLLTGE